jgi:hypothetical protein
MVLRSAGRKLTHGKYSAATRQIKVRLSLFVVVLRWLRRQAGLPVPDATYFRPRMTEGQAARVVEELCEERCGTKNTMTRAQRHQ